MSCDDADEFLSVCVSYVGTQRRLLNLLPDAVDPMALATAMSAQLDQLTAALRQARYREVPIRRRDPGD
jgi:hypothetical protein